MFEFCQANFNRLNYKAKKIHIFKDISILL